jgi:hypothetical protein
MIRQIPALLVSLVLLSGCRSQACPVAEGLSSPVLVFHEHIESLHKRLSTVSKHDSINLVFFVQRTMNDIVGFVAIFHMRNDVEKTESFVGFLTGMRRAGSVTGMPYSIVKYAQSESLFEIQSFLGVKDDRITKYECDDLKARFAKGLAAEPKPVVAPLPEVRKKPPVFKMDTLVPKNDSFVNLDEDLEEEIKPTIPAANSTKDSRGDRGNSPPSQSEATPARPNSLSGSLTNPSNAGSSSSSPKAQEQARQVLPLVPMNRLNFAEPTEVVVNMRTFTQASPTSTPTLINSSTSNTLNSAKPNESLVITTEIRNPNSSVPSSIAPTQPSNLNEPSQQPRLTNTTVSGKEAQSGPAASSGSTVNSTKGSSTTSTSVKSDSAKSATEDDSLNFNYDYIRDLYDKYSSFIQNDDSTAKEAKKAAETPKESAGSNSSTRSESATSSPRASDNPVSSQSSIAIPNLDANNNSSNTLAASNNNHSNSHSRNHSNRFEGRDSTPSSRSFQPSSNFQPFSSSHNPGVSGNSQNRNSSSQELQNSSTVASNQSGDSSSDSAREAANKATGRYPTYSELYGEFAGGLTSIQQAFNNPSSGSNTNPSPPRASTPSSDRDTINLSTSDASYEKLVELLRKTQETEAQQIQLIKKLKDETELIQKLHLLLAYIRRQEASNPKSVTTGKVRPTEFSFNNLSQNNRPPASQRLDELNLEPELQPFAAMSSADLLRVVTQKERFVALLTNMLVSNYQVPSRSPQQNSAPLSPNNVVYGPVNSFSNLIVDGRAGRIIPLEQTKAVRITQSIPSSTLYSRTN